MTPERLTFWEQVTLASVLALTPLVALFAPQGQHVLLPAGALAFLALGFVGGRHLRMPRVAAIGLAAFAALSALSLAWSAAPGDALVALIKAIVILGAIAILLGAVEGADEHGLARALAAVCLGLCAGLALSALELSVEGPIYNLLRGGRPFGDYVVNRAMVAQVLIVWPAAGYLFLTGRRGLGAGLLVAASVLATLSASETAVFAIGLGLATFAMALVAPRLASVAVSGVLTIGIIAAPVIAANLSTLLPAFIVERMEVGTGQARISIWEALVGPILDRPLTGWGFNATKTMTFPDIAWLYKDLHIPHPHNAALQAWMDFGAGGALALTALVLLLARVCACADAAARPFMLAALVAGAGAMLTAWDLWASWWLATLGAVAAAAYALGRLADAQTAEARANSR